MWTNDELIEIRDRAELEASNDTQNLLWRCACLNLAAGASHLLSVTERICHRELTAMTPCSQGFTPQSATVE